MASWGDFSALAKAAKSTLSAAQKKIDAVLDIQEQEKEKTMELNKDEAAPTKLVNEEEGEEEIAPEQSSSTSLNRFQEDFFAAFGLSTASSTTTPTTPASSESTKPARSHSKSKSGDESSSKTPWKSLFNTFSGSSPASKEVEETKIEENADLGHRTASPDSRNVKLEKSDSSSQILLSAEDNNSLASSSMGVSATSADNQSNEETGGWCTESLVVPTTTALTTITNFDNVDFLTPADASPFFSTNAHLSFVGEDEPDGVDSTGVLVPETSTDNRRDQVSPGRDSLFYSTPEPTLLTTSDSISFSDADQLFDYREPTLKFDYSPSSSAPKASTSSCTTNETDQSAESLATVVNVPALNVSMGNSTASESGTNQPPLSLSSSSTERNLSAVFMDSTISSDSNEKSVATILDGGDEEIRKNEDDQEEEETLVSFDDEPVSTTKETNLDYYSQKQETKAETSFNVEKILTKVSSELEVLNYDRNKEFSRDDDADDFGLEMGSTKKEIENEANEDTITDDVGGESPVNIAESFVRLSRSESNNGGGGGGESNEGSGHSPTQPTTGGKSSEEASADELLDDVEAATTCSDVEIISTPPYDTVSERSSRSGIVSRTTVDWSFHPPSKLFHASKDNGARKKAHRRVGSDQSLASCESFPAGVCAASGISRSASFTVQDYEKKFSHLSEMLEARERKLLDIAKENAQLADENEQLRNELQQLHSRISRDANVDVIQRELSERLNTIERKYDSVCKERDALKRKCDNLEKEVASRVTTQQLKEKEEQIVELMAEGEKLSKQELKQGNVIKKLREKEKDLEKQLDATRLKLKDMDDLRQKLKEKDEQEIKYDEMVHELKNTVAKQEKTTSKLRSDLEDAKDKCASYKSTLENCARDLAELNQEKAMRDAEIQRLVAKAAESKEGELQSMLDGAQQQWQTERQSLLREIQCLRMSSTHEVDDYQRREQSLRWEIAQLNKKVQETEERNQELAESITSATKPLLRQLDSMQLSFRTQQANWERVEKSLYERINEAERTAHAAVEKERDAQTSMIEMRTRFGQVEKQAATLAKEKNKSEAALAAAKTEIDNVERLRTKYIDDLQSEKLMHQQALEALNKDKELIGSQFEYEKRQLKTHYDKHVAELTEKLNEKEHLLVSLRQQLTTSQDSMQRSVQPSYAQPLTLRISSESPPPPSSRDRPSRTPSTTSFVQDEQQHLQNSHYDTWPNDAAGGGYATLLERLRSRLQQREGELSGIKDELRSIQQNRDALAMQLISLSNSNCELEQRVQQFDLLRTEYRELDSKYQALLQLYGEQMERNEELQLDLQDIKAVYKEQLDSLLQRPAT